MNQNLEVNLPTAKTKTQPLGETLQQQFVQEEDGISIDKDADKSERTSTGKLISSLPSVRNLTMTSAAAAVMKKCKLSERRKAD